MKRFKIAMSALLILATLTQSCKKNKDEMQAATSPEGFWIGKFGNGSSLGINYAIMLKPNGTMRAYNMGVSGTDTSTALKGDGTWQKNGIEIKTVYQLNGYDFNTVGQTNSSFSSMDGTWTSNTAFTGGFILNKN